MKFKIFLMGFVLLCLVSFLQGYVDKEEITTVENFSRLSEEDKLQLIKDDDFIKSKQNIVDEYFSIENSIRKSSGAANEYFTRLIKIDDAGNVNIENAKGSCKYEDGVLSNSPSTLEIDLKDEKFKGRKIEALAGGGFKIDGVEFRGNGIETFEKTETGFKVNDIDVYGDAGKFEWTDKLLVNGIEVSDVKKVEFGDALLIDGRDFTGAGKIEGLSGGDYRLNGVGVYVPENGICKTLPDKSYLTSKDVRLDLGGRELTSIRDGSVIGFDGKNYNARGRVVDDLGNDYSGNNGFSYHPNAAIKHVKGSGNVELVNGDSLSGFSFEAGWNKKGKVAEFNLKPEDLEGSSAILSGTGFVTTTEEIVGVNRALTPGERAKTDKTYVSFLEDDKIKYELSAKADIAMFVPPSKDFKARNILDPLKDKEDINMFLYKNGEEFIAIGPGAKSLDKMVEIARPEIEGAEPTTIDKKGDVFSVNTHGTNCGTVLSDTEAAIILGVPLFGICFGFLFILFYFLRLFGFRVKQKYKTIMVVSLIIVLIVVPVFVFAKGPWHEKAKKFREGWEGKPGLLRRARDWIWGPVCEEKPPEDKIVPEEEEEEEEEEVARLKREEELRTDPYFGRISEKIEEGPESEYYQQQYMDIFSDKEDPKLKDVLINYYDENEERLRPRAKELFDSVMIHTLIDIKKDLAVVNLDNFPSAVDFHPGGIAVVNAVGEREHSLATIIDPVKVKSFDYDISIRQPDTDELLKVYYNEEKNQFLYRDNNRYAPIYKGTEMWIRKR